MDSQTYQLGFIGAGKLAGSVIRGLVAAQFCSPTRIIASEPNREVRDALVSDTGITGTADNAEAAEEAGVVFIGVKPGVVLPVLRELAGAISNKLVVSLAAGVRLASMEKVARARFLRALTNTPSAIRCAASALAAGSRSTRHDRELARKIFEAIGVVVEVDEKDIDAVTALSGSGPAFVYTVIEGLTKGGERSGLPPDVAATLAAQTVLGAARLAIESKLSPEELRKMVVTPGGTTAAGLAEMEKLGTSEGLIAAVETAAKRSREMAKETGSGD
jgi:pyrroline-5-carboxylate reductase